MDVGNHIACDNDVIASEFRVLMTNNGKLAKFKYCINRT